MTADVARALSDAREAMYEALIASQREDWTVAADALERAERRIRDLVDEIQEKAA